ncbi:MAG TPA: fibronectin type III domain-containing protein [Ignavibacteriales bacterium]|nr:fibronectin type III domain-containing protein [Ignavibacteriales bacterium]
MSSKFNSLAVSLFFLSLAAFPGGCKRDTSIAEPGSGLPPAVPSGLMVVAAHDGSVLIDWRPNQEANLLGYNVYRGVNDSLSLKKILFTTDSYFLDDSLSYDSTYYYRVSALDEQGKESEPAYFVKATPVNLNAPKAPSSPEINARNYMDSLSVSLKWQPNTEGDILNYEVYRSGTSGFSPSKDNLVGTALGPSFLDKTGLKPYVNYYYRITAVDKGGLKSTPAVEVSDMILGVPEAVFPKNGSLVGYFNNFVIKAVSLPAHYKIILQSNEYFGEIWSRDFTSSKINDTILVKLDGLQLNTNTDYYWRIVTFTDDNSEPNSVSALNKFTIRP